MFNLSFYIRTGYVIELVLTWHMKPGMTRWKADPLKPKPFSPVHSARKLSAVFGTTSALRSITILPAFEPPMAMSKKHLGGIAGDFLQLRIG